MTEIIEEVQHLQVNLLSRNEKYKLDSSIFSIPSDANEAKLNSLIKQLLQIDKDNADFEFFLDGESVGTVTLEALVNKNKIAIEKEIIIEYQIKKKIEKCNKKMKHSKLVHSLDFDGNYLFTACYDQNLYIWGKNGKCIGKYQAHKKPLKVVATVAKKDENVYVATSGMDTFITLWSFDPKKAACNPIAHLSDHATTVLAMVSVSDNDNRTLVSTSTDGSVKVWDVSNDAILEFEQKYNSVAHTENDSQSTTPPCDKPIMTIGQHQAAATGISATNSSKVVSCGVDAYLRVWDIDTASEINSIVGIYPFTSIAYSSSKKMALCGTKQRYAQIYNIESSESSIVTITLDGYHSNSVESVAWSDNQDDLVITTSWDGTAFLWDLRNPKEPYSKLIHGNDRLFSCCWKHGMCFVGGESGNVFSSIPSSFPPSK